jgi:hypothetical protein
MFQFINAHNGKTNVYLSCFHFKSMRTSNRPDYASAVVKWVPLDFDGLEHAIPEAFRLHNMLLDKGIEHCMDLSGGGLHVFVRATPEAVQSPAGALNGAQTWLEKAALGGAAQSVDKASFFGDPARVIRVPNTFNRNKGRWCVPLTQKTFEWLAGGNGEIKERAAILSERPVEVSLDEYVQPGEPLDISKWDSGLYMPARSRYRDMKMSGLEMDEEDSGVTVEIRNPLIASLVHAEMNNDQRGKVILFLMEDGFNQAEIIRFLREHLSPAKFQHCLYSERQVQRMYSRYVGE